MSFVVWLFRESVDENHPFMKMNRMKVVDHESAGGYEMYLMRTDHPAFPEDMEYQVAVQKSGMSFLSPYDQFAKAGPTDIKSAASALDRLIKVLVGWMDKYGKLSVASLDDGKTEKWESMLRWLGFSIEVKTIPQINKKYLVVSK